MDIKGKHMDIVDKIDKNDFIIRVRPNKNKSNGAWSGSADIVVITSELNDLQTVSGVNLCSLAE